jgi:WD40 repeat protein
MYRLHKFARRNRLVFATSAIITFSLVAWAVGGILYGIEQRRQSAAMAAIAHEAEQSRLQSEEDRQQAIEQRNEARQNQYYAEMVAGEAEIANQNHGGLYARLVNFLPVSGEEDHRDWEWYYLMSLCRPEDLALSAAPGKWKYAAWSPDGQYIGAPGAIWRAETGERIRRFNTSSYGATYRVAWSPDGQKFAWAMLPDENAIYIWDRSTDSIHRIAAHDRPVWSLAWSPDGSQIASGSTDHTMKIWDVASKTLQWSVPTPQNVTSLDWSPDGKLLAAGIDMRAVQLWDVALQKLVHELPASTGREMEVAWHPDGSTLAVCEANRWYVLNRETLNITKQRKLARGSAIDWSPDGSRIAVAHGQTVTIWDSTGEEEIAELNGHLWPLLSVSWCPDGRRIVTSDNAGEIKLWNLDRPIQPPAITTGSPLRSLRWLDDNPTLISVAQGDGSSAWWDARHGSLERREISDLKPPFELSRDGRFAAYYLKDENTILIVDASNGATRSVLRLVPERTLISYALSGDGSRILVQSVVDRESFLDFWEIDQERFTGTWSRNLRFAGWGECRLFTWDHAGMRLATVSQGDYGDMGGLNDEDHLHIFEAAQGQRILKWNPSGDSSITGIAWNPDGRLLALGTSDGRVEVVELENRRQLFSEKLDSRGICALAWHPSGNRLACATLDGAVKLVTSSNGKVLLRLSLPAGRATELAWSRDGQRLAAATSGGQIHLWDSGRAHEISPDGPRRGELARAYLDRARRSSGAAAEGAYREFLRNAPDNLDFWEARGSAYAILGDFERAAEEFSKGVEPDIQYAFESARWRAYALLGAGKVERYREACARLVDAFRDNPVPSNGGSVAWLCSLTRNRNVDSQQVAKMSGFDYDDADDGGLDERTIRRGASLYRDGQFDEAVHILTELAEKLDRGGDSTDQWELACTRYLLALARWDMGHAFQARRLLDAANRTADESPHRSSYWYWMDPIVLNTLRREAEARLSGDGGDQHATQGGPATEPE